MGAQELQSWLKLEHVLLLGWRSTADEGKARPAICKEGQPPLVCGSLVRANPRGYQLCGKYVLATSYESAQMWKVFVRQTEMLWQKSNRWANGEPGLDKTVWEHDAGFVDLNWVGCTKRCGRARLSVVKGDDAWKHYMQENNAVNRQRLLSRIP